MSIKPAKDIKYIAANLFLIGWRTFVIAKSGFRFLNLQLLQLMQIPFGRLKIRYWVQRNPNLYFGSIKKGQIQSRRGGFIGLSLRPYHFSEIKCDISNGVLPFASRSISKIQAEDVLEHIDFGDLPKVCNEIFRVLELGGVFRLSVPDYNSIVLKKRSIYDYKGRILADPLTGTSVRYDSKTEKTSVTHRSDGNSHLWFPTKNLVDELIGYSDLKLCSTIKFWHFAISENESVVEKFPDLYMPVFRSPPTDMRANGFPVSIIVDFTK
jgi:SAM-dependent methyltransferase